MVAKNVSDILKALQCLKGDGKWKRCGNCETCPYLLYRLTTDCQPTVMDDAIECIGSTYGGDEE